MDLEWTNSVGWPNIPVTNKYFEVRGVSVMEIENNLIYHNRDYWDWNTFITSVGVDSS